MKYIKFYDLQQIITLFLLLCAIGLLIVGQWQYKHTIEQVYHDHVDRLLQLTGNQTLNPIKKGDINHLRDITEQALNITEFVDIAIFDRQGILLTQETDKTFDTQPEQFSLIMREIEHAGQVIGYIKAHYHAQHQERMPWLLLHQFWSSALLFSVLLIVTGISIGLSLTRWQQRVYTRAEKSSS